MKKTSKLILSFLILCSAAALQARTIIPQGGKTQWKSVYTDLNTDCVEISAATEEAPIDFYEAECKAFGGYRLLIEGGDLRYGPMLSFGETTVDLNRPGSFHDVGSTKIEWVYQHQIDSEGAGRIEWKGLIYRLSVSSIEGDREDSILYSVRLDGHKSCLIGTSNSNEKARELVYNSRAHCK